MVDVEVEVLEEALLLRDVGADEGQVRLRLEARHEGQALRFEVRRGGTRRANAVVITAAGNEQQNGGDEQYADEMKAP